MKKILFLIFILSFVLTGCFYKKPAVVNDASKKQENRQVEKSINKQEEENKKTDEVEENKIEQKSENRASELKSISDAWNLYTNYDFGFSINIPKESKDEGKFQAIEDGDIVYIATDESYKYLKIKEKLLSAESDFKKIQGLSLVIIVKKVNNDIELEQFIKDKYGKKCKLGIKNQSTQEDIFDISIDSSGWDIKNTPEPWTKEKSCFVNYGTFIKYNPKNNLVASWDRGQAVNYFLKDGTAADPLISNSFKFINTDETADWQTYRNKEYGFEVKMSDGWSDYSAKKEKDGDSGYKIIFENSNRCVFGIFVSPVKDWEECRSEKNPNAFYWCLRELGRNEKYVFHTGSSPIDCSDDKLVNEVEGVYKSFQIDN